MQAVILAGGLGTRLSEETGLKPKPMVEIGGMPILWHIMKLYSAAGINEFVICCGYKGEVIKNFFLNYFELSSDITIDLSTNKTTIHNKNVENWKVTLVDTGSDSMTGGRLLAVKDYLNGEPFCFTYGDGVADVDIAEICRFHKQHGKLATLMVASPPGRFGAVIRDGDAVVRFQEKPKGDEGLINAGFFVLEPSCIDYISDLTMTWEQEPLKKLAESGQLMSFYHEGFWQPMDTIRDKNYLESLWNLGEAPWKIW